MIPPNIEKIAANAEAGKPDAQFLMSQICQQGGDVNGAHRWLKKAAANHHVEALGALGYSYEKGHGVSSDMPQAMQYYDRAVQAGSKIAAFQKAQLLYKSKSGIEQSTQIRRLMLFAAEAGILPALRTVGYLAMHSEADRHFALECMRRAAVMGDPVSSFNLGWCLAEGWRGDEAKTQARYWLQQASNADYPLANSVLKSIPEEKSAAQAPSPGEAVDFNVEFALYPALRGVDQQVMNQEPAITVYSDVLNAVDRAYLMFIARPYLKRAAVIDPDGDSSGMVSQVRTNQSTYIPFELVDAISRCVELKIIGETDEDLMHSEPMSILFYSPGESYRPHFDYFNPRLDVSKEFMKDGGQRTASAVTYLIAPTSGGGTSFPQLDLTVPPQTGGTLWFRNCFDNGDVDERSLHAGDPVDTGSKWVVTKWFREKPTNYQQI